MSDEKPPPFQPFPNPDRTVIRPNPGGRRQAPIQPPHQPPQSPTPSAPGEDWFASQRQGARPNPFTAETQFGAGPAAPSQPPSPALPEGAGIKSADIGAIRALGVPDDNPIMRAARPLLVLLSNLRIAGTQQKVAHLMDSVAQSITQFERDLLDAGVPENQIVTAKYVLCATADDIVQNIPRSDRHVWTQYSMLSRFFHARTSGVGFFEELAKVKANPALHYDLLELMHACLSLGFEGQYRSSAGGDIALQQIRRDVYQTLRHIRPRPTDEIAPHWRGLELPAAVSSFRVPVWAVASVAAVALVGTLVLLRILLGGTSEALAERMIELHPLGEIQLARSDPTPLVPVKDTTQLECIRTRLADEIASRQVAVDLNGNNIRIRLVNDLFFASGSADIDEKLHGVIAKVASSLDPEPNEIFVHGHTDNVPVRSRLRFKSNIDLSEQRALSVAEIMKAHLQDPARLKISGFGPDRPVANNKTPEGRAQNRRVEVLLPGSGAPCVQ